VDPTETEEWLEELVERWAEVYKKSMTTLVLLQIIRERAPVDAAAIAPAFTSATGWSLTERGLYRSLRRLSTSGLLAVTEVPAARTGATRKEYQLTPVGAHYLERIEGATINHIPKRP
jgi:DNA-binding PadR family transcriptional regulator